MNSAEGRSECLLTLHLVRATTGLDKNGGKGSNGGVWEWTTTLFDGHEGLAPTNIFTGLAICTSADMHAI